MFEIYDFIALQSGRLRAADFIGRIEKFCLGLGLFPERGVKRDDLRPMLRVLAYRRQATVAYMIDREHDSVVVLRVFGAGRDYESALRDYNDEP